MSKQMTGSMYNRFNEGTELETPYVGMGATEMLYTDRNPYTVQKVVSEKRVIVTPDKYKRVDTNGQSEDQEYIYIQTPLYEEEPKLMCRNPFHYLIEDHGKHVCKHYDKFGSCEGCEHYKKHRKTNGVVLIKCKNGWKQKGTETYFLLGERERYEDPCF